MRAAVVVPGTLTTLVVVLFVALLSLDVISVEINAWRTGQRNLRTSCPPHCLVLPNMYQVIESFPCSVTFWMFSSRTPLVSLCLMHVQQWYSATHRTAVQCKHRVHQ